MKKLFIQCRYAVLLMPVLLGTLLTACGGGGGQAPILGGVVVTNSGPMVTSVAPVPNAAAVPVNAKQITATFDRAMDASTITGASFTLACPLATPITNGVISYNAASTTAIMTLPASPNLPVGTLCVATITTAAKSATGQAIASPFSWSWTTSAAPDLTAPTVAGTSNVNGATGVPTNTKIGVTFSEAMDLNTVNTTNLLVRETVSLSPVAGTVVYSDKNAVFTPTAPLLASTQYTVTAKGGVGGLADISGNVLASDNVTS